MRRMGSRSQLGVPHRDRSLRSPLPRRAAAWRCGSPCCRLRLCRYDRMTRSHPSRCTDLGVLQCRTQLRSSYRPCPRANDAGQLEHFHDLFLGGSKSESIADMLAQARLKHMRGRSIEGRVDELLDLGLQHSRLPGPRRERSVSGEELRIEPQHPVPELVPVAALGCKLGLDLLLTFA